MQTSPTNSVVDGRKESKKRVKFPCKLCNGDILTHLYSKIQDAQCLLVQQGSSSSQDVLTNPFPKGNNYLLAQTRMLVPP